MPIFPVLITVLVVIGASQFLLGGDAVWTLLVALAVGMSWLLRRQSKLAKAYGEMVKRFNTLAAREADLAARLSRLEADRARPDVDEQETGAAADTAMATAPPADTPPPIEVPPTAKRRGNRSRKQAASADGSVTSTAATTVAITPTPSPQPAPRPVMDEQKRIQALARQADQTSAAAQAALMRRVEQARAWLLGGNTVLRVGLILLFLGLAFLLNYATEGLVIPVEIRYAGVALAALVLIGLGWRLRERRRAYALLLQGTGIGVLYLTVFAAMRLHPLLPPLLGFALLVAITASAAVLAVLQNAMGLAAAAALGGFAAPLLASTGEGNHVMLFSYFALLNAGILTVAWYRAWRVLNVIGFVGTFGIGFAWGLRSYEPALYASTQPFLILFFAMYVAISLLFARQRLLNPVTPAESSGGDWLGQVRTRGTDYVDGTLLFGVPLVGFGLQYAIVPHFPLGPAFSALVIGMAYMLLARILSGRSTGRTRLLVDGYFALGVIFGTLAIPLGLDARWTSAAWAVEGAGIYWLAVRQDRAIGRAFGLLLQFGAAVVLLSEITPGVGGALLTGPALGSLLIGASMLATAWFARQAEQGGQLRSWEGHHQSPLTATGLVFGLLAVPLAAGVSVTVAAWAILAPVIVEGGMRLRQSTAIGTGVVALVLAGVMLILGHGPDLSMVTPTWFSDGLTDRFLFTDDLVRVLVAAAVLTAILVAPPSARSGPLAAVGLLLAGGAALWVLRPGEGGPAMDPMAEPVEIGLPFLVFLAAAVTGWRAWRGFLAAAQPRFLSIVASVAMAWAAVWWTAAITGAGRHWLPPEVDIGLVCAAFALGSLLATLAAQRLNWPAAAKAAVLIAPAAFFYAVLMRLDSDHPAAAAGWAGWPLVIAAYLFALRRALPVLPRPWATGTHAVGVWMLLALAITELGWLIGEAAGADEGWRQFVTALLPALFLIGVARQRLPAAIEGQEAAYRLWAAVPVALLSLAWFWVVNVVADGTAYPLPYIPLLNPLELGLLFILIAWITWSGSPVVRGRLPVGLSRAAPLLAGASAFALCTAAVCRLAHHWQDVPYQFDAMANSMFVQAGWSILWSLLAMGAMIQGHRRAQRPLWLGGAALIALVVLKLILVELGDSGSLARIVAFIGVGAMLLVIGYFAPLPPKPAAQKETA